MAEAITDPLVDLAARYALALKAEAATGSGTDKGLDLSDESGALLILMTCQKPTTAEGASILAAVGEAWADIADGSTARDGREQDEWTRARRRCTFAVRAFLQGDVPECLDAPHLDPWPAIDAARETARKEAA